MLLRAMIKTAPKGLEKVNPRRWSLPDFMAIVDELMQLHFAHNPEPVLDTLKRVLADIDLGLIEAEDKGVMTEAYAAAVKAAVEFAKATLLPSPSVVAAK